MSAAGCASGPQEGRSRLVVFSVAGAIVAEFSGSEAYTTSNRMELTAVLEAIKRAPLGPRVCLVTDSGNVIGWGRPSGWRVGH